MNIQFDFSEVISEFNLVSGQGDALAKGVLDSVTAEVHRQWGEAAKQALHSTRAEYLSAIKVVEDGPLQNTVYLDPANKMAMNLEDGIGAYDMKEGFKKSPKVKVNSKGGWYLTIPFRVGTPGTTGDYFPTIMPQDIYQLAKRLAATTTGAGGTKGGVLKVDVNSASGAVATHPATFNAATGQSWAAYVHKSSVFDGIQRQEKTAANGAKQSSYVNFRRVGSNSDANSWINKGIQAYNLADRALDNTDFDLVKENATDAILTQMGF